MKGGRVMVYHASGRVVELPVIRKSKYKKDFSWGFYCIDDFEQAKRWARRNIEFPTINYYSFKENSNLKILKFDEMNNQWLDFIADCRKGIIHSYDIVQGPMVDDTVWNYVNDFLEGYISRNAFWELVKFKSPVHQISFHTIKALDCLRFEKSEIVDEI